MTKVRLAPKAQHDLDEIWLYVVSLNEDLERADGVLRSLHSAFTLLGDNPRMGVARPDFGDNVRIHVVRGYVIAYRVQLDCVEIARVSGGAEDILS